MEESESDDNDQDRADVHIQVEDGGNVPVEEGGDPSDEQDDSEHKEAQTQAHKKKLTREEREEKENEDALILLMSEGMSDSQFLKWLAAQRPDGKNTAGKRRGEQAEDTAANDDSNRCANTTCNERTHVKKRGRYKLVECQQCHKHSHVQCSAKYKKQYFCNKECRDLFKRSSDS